MAMPAVCPECRTQLHWISPPHSRRPGPVFYCPSCRRDIDPEKAVINASGQVTEFNPRTE